jgi:hypothetical protein
MPLITRRCNIGLTLHDYTFHFIRMYTLTIHFTKLFNFTYLQCETTPHSQFLPSCICFQSRLNFLETNMADPIF